MKSRAKVLLVALVSVAVVYTAAAWAIGINVQRQLERREDQLLQNAPYLALITRQYDRGIYTSTEQATYGLKLPAAFGGIARAVPAGATSSPQLTIRNTIHHGPLPGLRNLGLASIDTVLVLPPELSRKLDAIFGGRPAVSIRTRLSWRGGTGTEFSSPAFQMQLPAGGTLNARGLSGSFTTGRDLTSWSGHITAGGFSAQGPRGRVDLGNFSLDSQMRRVFESLYVGDTSFKLASAEVQPSNTDAPFRLKGVSLRGTSSASGDYFDTAADLSADEVHIAKVSLSHVAYGHHLGHLEGTALASLTQALRAAQAAASPGAPPAALALRDAFSRDGIELLVHDPVLEITHMDFAMPEGQFHLSAKLAAPGLRRADLSGPAGLVGAIPFLDCMVDLRVDTALVSKLLESSAQAAQHSDQIQKLEQQGYLKREGATFTARLVFRHGKLTVNGQSYPPAPTAAG